MKYLLISILSCSSLLAVAQANPGMESGIFRLEKGFFDSRQVMIGRKVPPAEVVGDYYLDTTWHQGTFTMKDGRRSATYPLRYDIENALLEVRWNGQLKVVGEEYLSCFHWSEGDAEQKRTFVNGLQFRVAQSPVSGFLELAYQGSDSVLVSYGTYLKQPDYVAGLDMGSRHPEIIKTKQLYILENGVMHEIKGRKDFLNYADRLPKKVLKSWIKKQKLNLKNASDLARLMEYYETNNDLLE